MSYSFLGYLMLFATIQPLQMVPFSWRNRHQSFLLRRPPPVTSHLSSTIESECDSREGSHDHPKEERTSAYLAMDWETFKPKRSLSVVPCLVSYGRTRRQGKGYKQITLRFSRAPAERAGEGSSGCEQEYRIGLGAEEEAPHCKTKRN